LDKDRKYFGNGDPKGLGLVSADITEETLNNI